MGDIIAKAVGFLIFILVAYALKKKGLIRKEDRSVLGGLLININLPCVIISGFQTFEYDNSLIVAAAIGLFSSLLGIFIGYLVSRKGDKETQIMHMMNTTGYNIGIFTLPFVASFLSAKAFICAVMFDIPNAVMVFGTSAAIASAVVNKEKKNPIPGILKHLFSTIPFVTYVVMLIVVTVGIQLPEKIFIISDIGSDATAYLAMIMIGVMIEFDIKKEDLIQAMSALVTRYGYSLVIAIAIYFLPFDIEIRKALIISTFSPVSTASIVFSEKLGCKSSVLGVFSSLNIVISMSVILCVVIFL